jgi:hypothetical protein
MADPWTATSESSAGRRGTRWTVCYTWSIRIQWWLCSAGDVMLPYEDTWRTLQLSGKLKVRLLTHTRAHMSTMQLLLPTNQNNNLLLFTCDRVIVVYMWPSHQRHYTKQTNISQQKTEKHIFTTEEHKTFMFIEEAIWLMNISLLCSSRRLPIQWT